MKTNLLKEFIRISQHIKSFRLLYFFFKNSLGKNNFYIHLNSDYIIFPSNKKQRDNIRT